MNVGIGNEAAEFLNWEHINVIFIAVCEVMPPTPFSSSLKTVFDLKVFHCAKLLQITDSSIQLQHLQLHYRSIQMLFLYKHTG
jgi:hypothetical protein